MDIGKIENLGIDRVLKRGSGEIIAQRENALFIRDSISGVFFWQRRTSLRAFR